MTGLYWDDDGSQEGLLTRRPAGQCLSEREIEDFLFSRLSGVTREVIEEHILVCQHCLELVEAEQKILDEIKPALERYETRRLVGAVEEPASPAAGLFRRILGSQAWRPVAALAGVAFLAIFGILLYSGRGRVSEAEIVLRAERGLPAQETARQGQPLRLKPDVRGLPPLAGMRWQIVGLAGQQAEAGTLDASREDGVIHLPGGLKQGRYWVRLIDPESGLLLREFALQVR